LTIEYLPTRYWQETNMAPKFKPSAHSGSTFETTVELADGNEVDVTVEYSYAPGSPGKTYGPPEDCYPPEGAEVEVLKVYLSDDKTEADISGSLSKETIEYLSERCVSEGEEADRGAYESAMEDRADAQREQEWDP
jgi:hypothetical protein